MERSKHLLEAVIKQMSNFTDENVKVNDRDETTYGMDLLHNSFRERGIDPDLVDQIDEHRNNYLAGVAADFSERSSKRFKEDENLQERRGSVYLGKYDKVNLLASRNYENSEGKVIKNHQLIEHNRENNLLAGVQAWASALADN